MSKSQSRPPKRDVVKTYKVNQQEFEQFEAHVKEYEAKPSTAVRALIKMFTLGLIDIEKFEETVKKEKDGASR